MCAYWSREIKITVKRNTGSSKTSRESMYGSVMLSVSNSDIIATRLNVSWMVDGASVGAAVCVAKRNILYMYCGKVCTIIV